MRQIPSCSEIPICGVFFGFVVYVFFLESILLSAWKHVFLGEIVVGAGKKTISYIYISHIYISYIIHIYIYIIILCLNK